MSSSHTGISSEICRSYSRGQHCWRERRGGCPYVHDSVLRKEVLEERKLEASRSKLQQQYKSIGPNSQQSEQETKTRSAGKYFNNSQYDPRLDAVPQKNALGKNSSKEEISPSVCHDTPGSTTLISTFQKTSKIREPCKYYTNGKYCTRQNTAAGCDYIHDLALRRAMLAQNPMPKHAASRTPASKGHFSPYKLSHNNHKKLLTTSCNHDADAGDAGTAKAPGSENPLGVPIDVQQRVGMIIKKKSAAGKPFSPVISISSQHVDQETQTKQFVHDLAVCKTGPNERTMARKSTRKTKSKKKTVTKEKLHEVAAQGQEDRSVKPILQQPSTALNTSVRQSSTETHLVIPGSGIDMSLLLDSSLQPRNDESKDRDPMQLHRTKQHRATNPLAIELDFSYHELSSSELNVDSTGVHRALSRDTTLTKPAGGAGRNTTLSKRTRSETHPLDTSATEVLEKMLKQNHNSKNLFHARTKHPALKQGARDCVSKKRDSKLVAMLYDTGKENNTSNDTARSDLASLDGKDICIPPARQLPVPKRGRGFQKSVTVSKRVNLNASQSKRPFWTETYVHSWSASKSMKIPIKSDIEFPSLPRQNGDGVTNRPYISASKISKLSFSNVLGAREVQFVVGRCHDSKRNTANDAGIHSIIEAAAALKLVTKETAAEPWNLPDLRSWAYRNLTSNTAAQFLAPYVSKGRSSVKTPTVNHPGTTAGKPFPLFSLLPPELRIQIWENFLEGEKYEARIKWRWQSKSGYCTRSKFVPFNCVPRLLHVNRETRSLAMQRYELTFGTSTYRTLTYFDYNRDRLFIHTRSSGELQEIVTQMLPYDSSRVQRLALPLRDYVRNPSAHEFATSITTFKGLQKLTLLVGDGREDERWAKNQKLARKIQEVIGPVWWKVNGMSKAPKVYIQVIDAVKAHHYGIDGLMWG